MIFKTRPDIKNQFSLIKDLGIKNLIVSGCSFTYNNHESSSCTWPYYLRDLAGFQNVLDCSLPGAGNYHIANSLIWALEIDQPDPNESFVVVMWSGSDRDDFISPITNINNYPMRFYYTSNVVTALTGGISPENKGNSKIDIKPLSLVKTLESRSIENYLYMIQTHAYLQSQGYKFMFLIHADPKIPSRSEHFDIKNHLPQSCQEKLDKIFEPIKDPYSFCLKQNLLMSEDDWHPNPDGHLEWTKKILLPKIIEKLS